MGGGKKGKEVCDSHTRLCMTVVAPCSLVQVELLPMASGGCQPRGEVSKSGQPCPAQKLDGRHTVLSITWKRMWRLTTPTRGLPITNSKLITKLMAIRARSYGVQGVKIKFVAAGSAACHCIAGDADGKCYTWGRNEVSLWSRRLTPTPDTAEPEERYWLMCNISVLQRGQLGHGDLVQYNLPTVVKGLAGLVITGGANEHAATYPYDMGCPRVLQSHTLGSSGLGHEHAASYLHACMHAGAAGKHHSAVVTSTGESYTFGSNKEVTAALLVLGSHAPYPFNF